MVPFSEIIIDKFSIQLTFYKALFANSYPKFRPLNNIENSISNISQLSTNDQQDLQEIQKKAKTFLAKVKEIAEKIATSDNTIQPLKRENNDLRKYKQKLETELLDQQSIQEKQKKQVEILHSEIRNLEIELAIKEKESVSKAEKEHMKVNLLKFLQSAISKNTAEGETYLLVLFKLIGITEGEGEDLRKFSSEKEKTDRKKGLLSLIIRK